MAKTAVFWLNAFPAVGGASQDLSPHTIRTGQQIDYKRHCRYQFGEYTQTHEEHNNSMNPRMIGAIALRLVGNGQGSFYFLSITTGRVLNRLHAMAFLCLTEFRQPLQVQSHLEMPRILVQLGHTQRT